jgi:IMP dehydrogenase
MNSIIETLSFDDVLISPRYSEIESRKTISLKSQLTKNISLNLPLISSPMDTVTEDKMAIEMALNGGLGIIHRYNTIEQQVNIVKQVKRHLSFVIDKPYTMLETETVNDLLNKIKELNIYSFLITDETNTLKGIITKRDLNAHIMKNSNNTIPVSKIMTPFIVIAYLIDGKFTKKDVINLMNERKIEKIPIIDNNNKIKGMIIYRHLMNYKLNKNTYSFDKNNSLLVGAAVGIVGDYLERSKQLIEAGVDILCIDVANGFNKTVYNVTKELKTLYPTVDIMVGNVCNPEGFEFLCKAGADCIRVGIGNGSICSTRLVTGVGSGQFTSLMQCREIARKYNVGMISDGGHLGKDGNIAKAFVVGANAMILGKTLAATDETPGKIINRNNRRVKYYRGMASAMAMASKAEISNQEYNDGQNPEGVDMEIEIKGPVKNIVKRIESSIKSTMSYIGCINTEILRYNENNIVYYKQSSGVMSETSIRGKTL